MRAGQLRHRVTFQTRWTGQDSAGQQVLTWMPVLENVPADVQPLSGREMLEAQAANAELSHTITVRFHPLFSNPVKVAAMRAIYSDGTSTHTLNLSSAVNVDARNRQIEIGAMEGLNQG